MEGDGLGLHLALLDIDLVSGEDNGNVLADAHEIAYLQLVSRVIYKRKICESLRCQLGTFL